VAGRVVEAGQQVGELPRGGRSAVVPRVADDRQQVVPFRDEEGQRRVSVGGERAFRRRVAQGRRDQVAVGVDGPVRLGGHREVPVDEPVARLGQRRRRLVGPGALAGEVADQIVEPEPVRRDTGDQVRQGQSIEGLNTALNTVNNNNIAWHNVDTFQLASGQPRILPFMLGNATDTN